MTGSLTSTYVSQTLNSTLALDLTLTANLTVTVASGSGFIVSGVISGPYGITLTGGGGLTLEGSNTYTGTTTVTAGGLGVFNANALGTTDGNTVVDGGGLLLFDINGLSIAENFDLTGGLWNFGGTTTLTGNITVHGTPQFETFSGATIVVDGVIDDGAGTSGIDLIPDAAGTIVLGGNNLFHGDVTVGSGTVELTNADGLGNAATSSSTTVSSGAKLEVVGGIALPSTKSIVLDGSTLTNVAGANTIAGGISLTANSTIAVSAGTLDVSARSARRARAIP